MRQRVGHTSSPAPAGTLFAAVVSHLLPVGYRNRFRWDKEAA